MSQNHQTGHEENETTDEATPKSGVFRKLIQTNFMNYRGFLKWQK